MIAIVDYDMGNVRSVKNALTALGAESIITSSEAEIRQADRVILPGVGNAAAAMEALHGKRLAQTIVRLRRPVLGICVGMQIMCRYSEEGDTEGLGIFDAIVRKLPETPGVKVPHTGWDTLHNTEGSLFKDIRRGEWVYYVHSYYAGLCTDTIATTVMPPRFSAALRYENFYGTQFHPEKSGTAGLRILENFLRL